MARDFTELEIQARVDNLIAMDNAIRDLGDEDLWMAWLLEGVPDGAVESQDWDILRFMATYEDETGSSYEQTVELYKELLAQSEETDEYPSNYW